jgi:hypothetical protein
MGLKAGIIGAEFNVAGLPLLGECPNCDGGPEKIFGIMVKNVAGRHVPKEVLEEGCQLLCLRGGKPVFGNFYQRF